MEEPAVDYATSVEEPALDYAVPVDAAPEDLAIDSVYSYDNYPCSINYNGVRSLLPRSTTPFLLLRPRPTAVTCMAAFDCILVDLPRPAGLPSSTAIAVA